MNAVSESELGGYFGLELPASREPAMPGALRFQSGRACLAALLEAAAPSRLWMPAYICDSMLLPLRKLGIPHALYGIDAAMRVAPGLEMANGELILYVNYFGLCGEGERDAVARFGAARVILDRAQAFYAPARQALATIYSPRKFFGLPDGGIMRTTAQVSPASEIDTGSIGRCMHLLLRHDGPAQPGYPHFQRAEASLQDSTPRAMSALTARLLDSIDVETARERRVANFAFLHERLGRYNEFPVGADATQGPLCYPLLIRREGLRDLLIRNKVFVPTYWPDVSGRSRPGGHEHDLARYTLALPCDQRYRACQLERAAALVIAALKTSSLGSAK